jgi:hypothetical protein
MPTAVLINNHACSEGAGSAFRVGLIAIPLLLCLLTILLSARSPEFAMAIILTGSQ